VFYKSINGELSMNNRLKKIMFALSLSSALVAPTMAMDEEEGGRSPQG
jgi:hypothetical protein